jgi:hypothetical protein
MTSAVQRRLRKVVRLHQLSRHFSTTGLLIHSFERTRGFDTLDWGHHTLKNR